MTAAREQEIARLEGVLTEPISVSYRVNTVWAAAFSHSATQVLRMLAVNGCVQERGCLESGSRPV